MLKEIMEEATYYYHPDHLGSVSIVSNHQGEPYERVEYLPFGEVWIEDLDDATSYIPFRFTSKELGPASTTTEPDTTNPGDQGG